jgi:hypothetical protein
MNNLAARGRALWGGFLVILGGVLLLEYFVELGVWPWVAFLTLFGLGFYALYAADRKHKWLLIPSYVLLTIAGLLTLTELDVLRGDVVAIYVFVVIAIPFLFVYLRNRRAWWALIPAYVMLALTGLIGLDALGVFSGDTEVSYIMFAIAFPFFFVYVRNTRYGDHRRGLLVHRRDREVYRPSVHHFDWPVDPFPRISPTYDENVRIRFR